MDDRVLHDMKRLALWRKKIEKDFCKWVKAMDRFFLDCVHSENKKEKTDERVS